MCAHFQQVPTHDLQVVSVGLRFTKGSDKRALHGASSWTAPNMVFLSKVHHLHINYVPILFALRSLLYLIRGFLFPVSRLPLRCFVAQGCFLCPGKLGFKEEELGGLEGVATARGHWCRGTARRRPSARQERPPLKPAPRCLDLGPPASGMKENNYVFEHPPPGCNIPSAQPKLMPQPSGEGSCEPQGCAPAPLNS